MDIENIAISAVKSKLAYIPGVQPMITSGDKVPSWDGDIYLYSSDKFAKSKLFGRIPTQVKGYEVKSINQDQQSISYPIETVDLNNYYQDGGVLFFVVYCVPDDEQVIIYCSSLLPYDIRLLLKDKANQKTISVYFQQFPAEKRKQHDLLVEFLNGYNLQKNLAHISDSEYEKILDPSNKDGNFFSKFTTISEDPIQEIFDRSLYIYRNIGYGVAIPVKKVSSVDNLSLEINLGVFCNGVKYYDSYCLKQYKDRQEVLFGSGIAITNTDKNTLKIDYTPRGTLNHQIVDLEFLMVFVEKLSFTIGKQTIKLKHDDQYDNLFKNQRERLSYLKTLKETFIVAGYSGEVEINSFTDIDWQRARTLIKIFKEKTFPPVQQTPETNQNGEFALCHFKIGNVTLLLLVFQTGNKQEIVNPYTSSCLAEISSNDNEKVQTSIFCFMEEQHFRLVSQMNFNAIMESIKKIPFTLLFKEHVIQMLLNMLRAYDAGSQDIHLLDNAGILAKWLCDVSEDERSFMINTLNQYQIYKRKRPLLDAEISKLHKFLEKKELDEDVMMGIYILLNDTKNYLEHYNKLTDTDKVLFNKYPIAHLMKKTDCNVEHE